MTFALLRIAPGPILNALSSTCRYSQVLFSMCKIGWQAKKSRLYKAFFV